MLTPKQETFLTKRQWFARRWPAIASLMLVSLLAFYGYLLWRVPFLANPFYVARQIEADAIAQSTLVVMAAMLPIAIGALVFVTAATILLGFAVFANERRYLQIVRQLQKQVQMPPVSTPFPKNSD